VHTTIGWRPTPEKNIETMPCWGKNSPEMTRGPGT